MLLRTPNPPHPDTRIEPVHLDYRSVAPELGSQTCNALYSEQFNEIILPFCLHPQSCGKRISLVGELNSSHVILISFTLPTRQPNDEHVHSDFRRQSVRKSSRTYPDGSRGSLGIREVEPATQDRKCSDVFSFPP